ncbi:SDR family oxidoreductase [Streptomyces liangshanensis]|uniref:SDR family oxidoreductase n=1 Tax=Streptomyces liangshanensis TaxID=2717324 RepID=A0A6G9H6T2_9ACTN|nr:SDR family oxidoreductase [Streptomyces liangshanensis]QIQ06255.1 SDR family oxidoreductase [Streptomyces liangshanensis]
MTKALPREAAPDLRGRLALVTGANSGIGFGVARRFVRAGADVVLAVRNTAKGAEAAQRLGDAAPGARVRVEAVDLSSLASVRDLGARVNAEGAPLHYLVNNAGILAPPRRTRTDDGFELQMATNYLGAFALTGLLLPVLRRGGGRVVAMSSLTARTAHLAAEDLAGTGTYHPYAVHSTSKLALLVFALELDRRSRLHDWGISSNAVHPGGVSGHFHVAGPSLGGGRPDLVARFSARLYKLPGLGNDVTRGSLLPFFAATGGRAEGGAYYAPAGFAELSGPPAPAKVPARAGDVRLAARLWEASEALTGVTFPGSDPGSDHESGSGPV